MSKDDMILLIKAYGALLRLNDLLSEMTKSGLYGTGFEDLFHIGDLLYRNCGFFDANSDEAYRRFACVMESKNLTPEEKYDLLTVTR